MRHILLLIIFCLGVKGEAATVAIVDSGTDFNHHSLKAHEWINPLEIPGNWLDDDDNGMADDINGWNFIDGWGEVFVREHLDHIHPVAYRLIAILSRARFGRQSRAEQEFFQKNYIDLPELRKLELQEHMSYLGQYAHGTHVAGIVSDLSPTSKILAARVFPDTAPKGYEHEAQLNSVWDGIFGLLYRLFSSVANQTFHQVSDYILQQDVDVANYSLGISFKVLANAALKLRGIQNPTQEEIAEEVRKMFAEFKPEGEKWVSNSPNTLFVMAAGNEGEDNDVMPAFPASIQLNNSISVAATNGYSSLAEFSNFGKKSVDIAAPGVLIESAVPSLDNELMLPMSGTSMAAPFVSGIAAEMKTQNPRLSASTIKKILMETVDKKEWLVEKVVSGGIVNKERAVLAASLVERLSVEEAITKSMELIADVAAGGTSVDNTSKMSEALFDLSRRAFF